MAPYYNTIIKHFILVFLLLISISSPSFSKRPLCLIEQRDALIQFNKTFATGSYYGCTGSWQNDTDCCMWDRVTCDNKTGDVIILHLGTCGLQGTISNISSLLPLQNMQSLDLSGNELDGSLSSFPQLPKLLHLDLSYCQLHGTIDNISSLFSLEALVLSRNIFSGMIPHCLGNLTKLQQLDLSLNQLIGPLPPSLNKCTLLELIDVSSNMLSDMFPSWISHLPNLRYVYLGKNRFYGPIDLLINGSSLSRLDLHQNSFSGHLPDFVGNSSLSILDLSSNSLEGPIPKLPQNLDFLSLSNNNFTGVLLSVCKSLPGVLELSNNSLTGTIPPCLLNCSDITLGMNKLEGAIPDVFTERCDIHGLIISRNHLTGPLPRSMVYCTSMRYLDLSHNSIEDSFPNWLEALPVLQVLVLQSNRFNGELKTLSNDSFPSLKVVDISNNNLTGLLPIEYFSGLDPTKINPGIWHEVPDLCEYFTAPYLCGYYYKFMFTIKGSTFEFAKPTDYLALIDMSNNNFRGEIPEAISKLSFLRGLNLSHNNLTGRIPPSIRNLTDLEWLDLSSNQLNGVIPSELTDLTGLSSLNLSYNELSGMIPSGKQFNTFGKESFVGNAELCGPQVEKSCDESNISKQPQTLLPSTEEDDFNAFDWKLILMGYGCGLIIGISIGYMVLELRRPEWFILLVEEKLPRKIARLSRMKN